MVNIFNFAPQPQKAMIANLYLYQFAIGYWQTLFIFIKIILVPL